ncbi:MAG: AraC family transcriptional regulator [Sphingomonadaceae bacterium]|nr:AraC family transcriptional regulator [Sphingomonadaceae bacterium]
MASRPATLLHFSTDAVEARLRPQLVGDVMARELAGGAVERLDGQAEMQLWCDWKLAAIGPGMVIGTAVQGGMVAARGHDLVRDGDDDVSIFFGRAGRARYEQNDRRGFLGPGDAVVIAHGRPVTSWWPDNEAAVLRLPRAVFGNSRAIDKAGGVKLDARSGATALLSAYVEATSRIARAQPVPEVAARHIAELAAFALDGTAVGTPARGAAVQAARVTAMREVIARLYADPMLTMARVAAAVGISERAGYAAFAGAQLSFGDLLTGVRLDRAREALAAGYAGKIVDLAMRVGFSDLSHFNRRFRARFGATPRELRG